jgi:hypothetical protein
VPQERALLNQAEKDTKGVDAEVLTYDSSNQVATVRFHHAIVYGKMDAVRYHFDGNQWQRIEESSNHASEAIGASAPQPQR